MTTKSQYLESFEQEIIDATNDQDNVRVDQVIDKYMELNTDEFDSDDLNEILDKYLND